MSNARDVRTAAESKGWLALCIVASGVALAVFAFCVAQRFGHPFELEWMEGGSLQHLLRIESGLPLYKAPSLEFVPFPYPPLYYYAALPFARLLGFELSTLRLVSLLSTLGTAMLIFLLVRFETRRLGLAIAGAGLFFATYIESGAYMDVARLDAFFALLVMAGVALLRMRDDATGWVIVGLLAAAATLTKQTAPAIFAPLVLWAFARDRLETGAPGRGIVRAGWITGIALVTVTLGFAYFGRGENDHFFSYILGTQAGHEIRWSMLPAFFAVDLFWTLPFATIAAAYGLSRHASASTALFYLAFFIGVVAACIVPRVKVGGALNNLIPLHATAIVVGCAGWSAWADTRKGDTRFERLAAVGLLLQFVWLGFDPRIAPPTRGDAEAGARFVEQLRRVEGEVLIPAHGYLAGMAGKTVFAHQMPIDDIERSGLDYAVALREEIAGAIAAQRFALIVDASDRFLERYPDDRVLKEHYRVQGSVFKEGRTLVPRSGWPVSPGRVWVPKRFGAGVSEDRRDSETQ